MKLKYIAALGSLFFATSAFAGDCEKECEKGPCKKDPTVSALSLTVEAEEAPEEKKEDPPKGPT